MHCCAILSLIEDAFRAFEEEGGGGGWRRTRRRALRQICIPSCAPNSRSPDVPFCLPFFLFAMPSLVVQKFYVFCALFCFLSLCDPGILLEPQSGFKNLQSISSDFRRKFRCLPQSYSKLPPTITPLIWAPGGHLKGQRALEKHSSEHFSGTPSQVAKTTPQSTFRPRAPGPWKSAPELQPLTRSRHFWVTLILGGSQDHSTGVPFAVFCVTSLRVFALFWHSCALARISASDHICKEPKAKKKKKKKKKKNGILGI